MNTQTATPAQIDAELYALYLKRANAAAIIARSEKQLTASSAPAVRTAAQHQIAKATAAIEAADVATAPLEAEYERRGGWTRYFQTTGSNGHIHSSMRCSTCRVTTRYIWLVELAGKTEAEMIAAYGQVVCTVCYPAAPVSVFPAAAPVAKADDKCDGQPVSTGSSARLYKKCSKCDHVGAVRAWRKHKAK